MESRENILQSNHKHGSRTKYFNKNIDTSRLGPPKATTARNKPKVKPVRFFNPYNQINPKENTDNYAHLVDGNA